MKTYRLADLNNGPFGEAFLSLDDAYAALAAAVQEGDAINAQVAEDTDSGIESAADFYCIVDQDGNEI